MAGQPNIDLARIIPVIQVLETRGSGEKSDPVRLVTSFWSLKGEKLFEKDPYACSMDSASSKASSAST